MVLYCVQHSANIMRSIIHRFKYHAEDKTIIITDKRSESNYCPKLRNVSYIFFPDFWTIVRSDSQSKEVIKKSADQIISKFFEKNSVELKDFSNIYVINDMYNPFTLFFEIHSIKYSYIESCDNNLNFFLENKHKKVYPKEYDAYNCLISEMHLQDGQGANCIKNYLFSENSFYPDSCTVPSEIFGYYETLISLNENFKDQIITVFKLNEYDFNTVILFNSTGLTSTILSDCQVVIPCSQTNEDKVIYFYNVILDYYFSGLNFALKLHPETGLKTVDEFQKFDQLPNYIPVELFALTDKKYSVICPIKSTGIDIFRQFGFDTTCFGVEIATFFKHIHFVYLILSFIKSHGIIEKVHVYGITIEQLNYFKHWAYKEFKNVNFEQLAVDNARYAEYIIAVSDSQFSEYIKQVNDQCIVLTDSIDKVYNISDFHCQRMDYSIIDTSQQEQVEIQRLSWFILTKENKNTNTMFNFCYSYTLENSKLRIQSTPYVATYIENNSMLEAHNKSLQEIKNQYTQELKFFQLYYEAEINGYNLKKYFEENNLFAENVNMAFFAVDEFGLIVYRICERCGIHFSALLSDVDRKIEHTINSNFTQALEFKSIQKGFNSRITHIFMGTTYNVQHINLVRKYSHKVLIFDSISMYLYTRACVIDRIAELVKNHPGVHAGIFNAPFISQVAGEHSSLEEYFSKNKVQNILNIKDGVISEKAKNLCYKAYGFDDQYIDEVSTAQYKYVCYNGAYLLEDRTGKYVNILNHRRVTTDAPAFFSNTIYFFGHSCVIGYHVDDSGTIESNLQRIINENNLPYIVHNCGNSYSSHYDWIFGLTKDMQFQPGDILLFCTHIDWQTEQYLKNNDKKFLSNILGIYTTPVFQRPHDHGEVFTDDHHCNGKGYGLIAQKIFDDIKAAGFFDKGNIADEEEMKTANMPSNNVDDITRGGDN